MMDCQPHRQPIEFAHAFRRSAVNTIFHLAKRLNKEVPISSAFAKEVDKPWSLLGQASEVQSTPTPRCAVQQRFMLEMFSKEGIT